MNDLHKLIEALIFSSEQPISIAELQTILFTYSGEEVSLEAIQEQVDSIQTKYESDDFVFEIVKTGGGYQFLSKPYYHKPITTLLQHRAKRKLSVAALECLSIIAYSQPVTKVEVEQIRGVNCDHTIQKLMERDLINIVGRSETAGRPLLYGTTQYFMDYFGINGLAELPRLKEFEQKDMSIGSPSDIMEISEEEAYNKVILNNERREEMESGYDQESEIERRDDAQTDNYEKDQQENDDADGEIDAAPADDQEEQ
ncbi:MAG: SMC-Scp complex subunit ScpB [Chitinophagales bacterium]